MTPWNEHQGTFTSWDNSELFFRSWKPLQPSDKAVVFIHRGHEHSGRIKPLLEGLGLTDFWGFSWDNRGHGQSPGKRGHADSYYHLVKDLNAFVSYISSAHAIPVSNIVVVANSVGAVTAATWVHDFAPRIRALVLAAPAFRIRLYVPLAIPGLRLLEKFKPGSTISSYVKSKMLTHDPHAAAAYDSDPLITKDISNQVLLGLHDTATRIIADAGAIVTPTLVLSAGADWVVKNRAQRNFYKNLGASIKQMDAYPGFYHALLYEKERSRPLARIREFIETAFTREVDFSTLPQADQGGFTKTEYDLLKQPTCPFREVGFLLQKIAMHTLGRLSNGIRLGMRTGFDSGKTLDYVYQNTPTGITPIGRAIDKGYINAIGWRGIRQRGQNLEACLDQAIQNLAPQGPVRILDVATGCGRYVLNVLDRYRDQEVSACLRDYEVQNVTAGQQLAEEMGITKVHFEQGDAFNRASLAAITPKPHICIVSGLYELFGDNQLLQGSLAGLADAVEPGGYLIYTGQPWHPQVEVIARTLTNRDGDPWIMRRRTQAELDELVRQAGFAKQSMEIDNWGIFTVSVARRVERTDEETATQ